MTALRGIDKATRESVTFWMALACVAAAVALVYLFLRSKRGWRCSRFATTRWRPNRRASPVARMKLAVYVVSAFGAGLAGALYFVGNLRISPDAAFSVNWTAFAIFMVVIGGIGRIEGPLVGALIFWALNKFLSDYGTWYLLGLGLLAIVTTLFFKQGLWGFAQQRWGWSLFPTQRRLRASRCGCRRSDPARHRRALRTWNSILMRNINEHTITAAVLERMAGCDDPRLKELMSALVRAPARFRARSEAHRGGVGGRHRVPHATGQKCDGKRQEFILLSDTLGLSMLTVALNHAKSAQATEATVFGPFHVAGAPRLRAGRRHLRRRRGRAAVCRRHRARARRRARGRCGGRRLGGRCRGFYDVQRRGLDRAAMPRRLPHRRRRPVVVPRRDAGGLSDPDRRPGGRDAAGDQAPSVAAGARPFHDQGAGLRDADHARVPRRRPVPRQRRRVRRAQFADRRLRSHSAPAPRRTAALQAGPFHTLEFDFVLEPERWKAGPHCPG